jgi:PAS domain S-box-containing protein
MSSEGNTEQYKSRIKELETQLSELKFRFEEAALQLAEEQNLREFYQFVADFTPGWELWFEPDGKIKYCSPSCFDLPGFTSNQIVAAESVAGLLVYEPDCEKFSQFLSGSLHQMLVSQSLEFRILTRHKQLCWCLANVRGVHNKQGRYLGIRMSVQDITRLKRAMGHIHELSQGKEIENRAKPRIKSQLDSKERELVSFLLQLSQKNEWIAWTTKQLKKLAAGNPENIREKLLSLIGTLENIPATPVDWDSVVLQLENLHPGFLGRLHSKHPNLTAKEKKLSAYLRLGLSGKEIAGLQNVTPKSIEIARVRLRKKLKLSHEIRLSQYFSQL